MDYNSYKYSPATLIPAARVASKPLDLVRQTGLLGSNGFNSTSSSFTPVNTLSQMRRSVQVIPQGRLAGNSPNLLGNAGSMSMDLKM